MPHPAMHKDSAMTLLKRRTVLAVLVAAACTALATPGDGQTRGDLRAFMRQKLDLSKTVLEGLSVEDYEKIAEGARGLKLLSEDAQWRVSPNVNYLRLSNEFQAQTQEMIDAAGARNIDGSTLAYVQMTLTCVKCHKLVRDEKLVRLDTPPRR